MKTTGFLNGRRVNIEHEVRMFVYFLMRNYPPSWKMKHVRLLMSIFNYTPRELLSFCNDEEYNCVKDGVEMYKYTMSAFDIAARMSEELNAANIRIQELEETSKVDQDEL